MKTIAVLIACLLFAAQTVHAAEPTAGSKAASPAAVPVAASPAAVRVAASPAAAAIAKADAKVTIPVGGMTCGGCVNNVSGKLQAVEGVKTVAVDLDKKQAVVTYDAAKCSPKALTEAISDAGFEPGTPVAN